MTPKWEAKKDPGGAMATRSSATKGEGARCAPLRQDSEHDADGAATLIADE